MDPRSQPALVWILPFIPNEVIVPFDFRLNAFDRMYFKAVFAPFALMLFFPLASLRIKQQCKLIPILEHWRNKHYHVLLNNFHSYPTLLAVNSMPTAWGSSQGCTTHRHRNSGNRATVVLCHFSDTEAPQHTHPRAHPLTHTHLLGFLVFKKQPWTHREGRAPSSFCFWEGLHPEQGVHKGRSKTGVTVLQHKLSYLGTARADPQMEVVSGIKRLKNGERGARVEAAVLQNGTWGRAFDEELSNCGLLPFLIVATYSTGMRSASITWRVFGRLSMDRMLTEKDLNTTGLCTKAKCLTQGLDRWV